MTTDVNIVEDASLSDLPEDLIPEQVPPADHPGEKITRDGTVDEDAPPLYLGDVIVCENPQKEFGQYSTYALFFLGQEHGEDTIVYKSERGEYSWRRNNVIYEDTFTHTEFVTIYRGVLPDND